jgi:hypothetical protein
MTLSVVMMTTKVKLGTALERAFGRKSYYTRRLTCHGLEHEAPGCQQRR